MSTGANEYSFETYVTDVLNGHIPTSQFVKQAVQRHVNDLTRDDLFFDRDLAAWICYDVFPKLFQHTVGTLAPFHLAPWQAFVIAGVFGWKRKDTGLRKYNRVYIEMARKQGKSTLMAAIALFMLLFDNEPGAHCYIVATKRDQTKEVWNPAVQMVQKSAELSKLVRVYRDFLSGPNNSTFTRLSSDAKSLDGLNVHCAIIDELHKHPTPRVWEVMDTATGARRQPIIWIITTAGTNQAGVCYERRDYMTKVLNGTYQDDDWFGFIAEIDDGDDFKNEAIWEKANPNIRFIPSMVKDLRSKVRRAISSPSELYNFLTLHMCRWTQQSECWIPLEKWDACLAKPAFTYEEMKGRPCFAALDLSQRLDLSAACLLFPPLEQGEKWRYMWRFFLPEDTADEYIKTSSDKWRDWIVTKQLTLTPGARVDQTYIRTLIQEWARDFDLLKCGYDPTFANTLSMDLAHDGIEMVEIQQNNIRFLTEGTQEFESQIFNGEMQHNGGQLLRWQIDNVKLDRRDSFCKPVRPDRKRNTKKVDGIVAAVMACCVAVRTPIETAPADMGFYVV